MPMCLPMTTSRRGLDSYSLSMGRRSAGAALEMSVRTGGGVDECDGVSSWILGRRTKSAGRIPGLTSSPAALNEYLDQMTIAQKYRLRSAEAQRKAAAALETLARDSNNAAVADVGRHQADLLKMDADHATRLAGEMSYYIKELRKINEAEKEVREAEMRVRSLCEKEAKIAESLRKGNGGVFIRRRSEDDTLRKKQQLEKVRMDIEAAKVGFAETKKEMEVIKMYRYRNGMQGIADSVISYASVTAAIFGCFRELTEMVPAISTQDVMTMNYDGASITQNCVSRLRRDIASPSTVPIPSQLMGAPSRRHNRHGGGRGGGGGAYPAAPSLTPPSLSGNGPSTPPPPYTPTAPSMSVLPQPGCGGGAATVTETPSTPSARPSPPRSNSLYPKLPANPYRRSGLHS